ncbi:2,4-dihydroxyhept-2-ene-1,7-dioic acid aldolase [Angomonas deanei]|uniref:HpcH/HpaI aldolase/citrate lyase family, putative n=1 Tax=Angomonas deanei TaxID=59799 RepID=A0A7G2CC61_9TRYP|nr:2,4-dihydroxyhept-2-ene-1,7-dioic acid aldolase [Angomonas deanei]CAD2217400.1 HpcH/HpaI aldolase/citrate lyase family, putative [Angomonas deanei]|eukprot:EPY43427.1 2,4-dihydroxyhept-2-ene-1,7-dioic acid aldolase [Angomonas deanei]
MSAGAAEFKAELRAGNPKFGVFLNSASPLVAGQFSHCGYDWLLIDAQHSPVDSLTLAGMVTAIRSGPARIMVRVGSTQDRSGIQNALDSGADGILIPYVNNAKELQEAVSCCFYPTQGTRSVYTPQQCMNSKGLLGYVPESNKNVIVAFQVETASCIENLEEIMAVKGVDIAFLGQNDLCMSMGLYDGRYVFPEMYFSKELNEATQKLIATAQKNNIILGIFLFGDERVGEFIEKGFTFFSLGSDLHHAQTQAAAYIKNLATITASKGKNWKHQPSALV